jgi:acyl-CoA thioester hydrolase
MNHPYPARNQFHSTVRVRFAETDANGHMSHVSPVLYMEQARCEYLGALGVFSREEMERTKKTFVLATQTVDYKNQAYYDQVLDIYIGVSRLGTSSMENEYHIINRATGTLIAICRSTVVYFDVEMQKSTQLPSDFKDRILALDAKYAAAEPVEGAVPHS